MRYRILAGSLLSAALVAPPMVSAVRDVLESRATFFEHEEAHAKRHALGSQLEALRAAGIRAARPPYGEGYDRGADILSYDLSFRLDPAVRMLEGTAVLRVSAVAAGTRTLSLDFSDAYTLLDVKVRGTSVTASRTTNLVTVPFDPPLRPRSAPRSRSPIAACRPRALLTFWTHARGYAATSLSEPFGARTLFPCVDDPSDRAMVTVHATVPAGYVAASAGLVTETPGQNGERTFTWKLPQSIPTYLVSLNVAPYVTLEDTFTSSSGVTMPITSYFLPQSRDLNVARHAGFRQHLSVLSDLFGDYPYLDTKYGIVESHFSGGMEHPSMTSIGSMLLLDPNRNLTNLLEHELGHQWWGDQVTMRTWDDIFLNEGFATYSEVLYQERVTGEPAGARLTRAYDDGLYNGALGRSVVASATNPFQYSGAIYNKGGFSLHMLRKVVGDEAFFATLRLYSDRHRNGSASRKDLRAAFEEISGLDLKQHFDQWIETPFRIVLRATYARARRSIRCRSRSRRPRRTPSCTP
jgi:aminopeptidase N